jgi:hypothetical protein
MATSSIYTGYGSELECLFARDILAKCGVPTDVDRFLIKMTKTPPHPGWHEDIYLHKDVVAEEVELVI